MRPACDAQLFSDVTVRCPHSADTTVRIAFLDGKLIEHMFCPAHALVASIGATLVDAHFTIEPLGNTYERCAKDAITFCCSACERCGHCNRCCDCRPEDLDDAARRQGWRDLGRLDDGRRRNA